MEVGKTKIWHDKEVSLLSANARLFLIKDSENDYQLVGIFAEEGKDIMREAKIISTCGCPVIEGEDCPHQRAASDCIFDSVLIYNDPEFGEQRADMGPPYKD